MYIQAKVGMAVRLLPTKLSASHYEYFLKDLILFSENQNDG